LTRFDDGWDEAGEVIEGMRRPLLLTHAKPDGDAIGSIVAGRSMLSSRGARPLVVVFDPVPDHYEFMVGEERLTPFGEVSADALAECDGVLVMDTCTYNQLEPMAEWLRGTRVPKIALDHHVTRDALADYYVVDEKAAAACEILYMWARRRGWRIDNRAVTGLFVGMATDTGWFRFSNTRPETLEIAADLLRRGAETDELYRRINDSMPANRVRLLGVALGAMELHHDDEIALIALGRDVFEQTGTTPNDTEGIINEALRIGTVQTAIVLSETGPETTKVSFRSKGRTDVAELASEFGGGGHVRAAGARLSEPIQAAKRSVLTAAIRKISGEV
jgi:bifunctional oligoribonuclease and PAP phosphatase NrnA